MGSRLISLKGQSATWRGISSLTVNDRGQRRFSKLENGYVSSDGGEIRSMPGWATLVDPSIANNTSGYGRYIVDAVRPIFDGGPSPKEYYKTAFDQSDDSEIQTMIVRALPACYFGFEQVGDELFIFGETRFREAPLMSNGLSRTILSPYSVAAAFPGFWGVTMDSVVGGYTSQNSAGPGLNGLTIGECIYVEGITVDDAAKQAIIDAGLNGKVHQVTAITTVAGRSLLTLSTAATAAVATTLVTDGDVHKVRNNRSDNYPSTGIDPYTATYDDRPDDHNALTVWRIRVKPDLLTQTGTGDHPPVFPAYVANRQRDFGDDRSVFYEGLWIYDSSPAERRGVSRREQRRLPYRPNVECATDRIILACPQYGCMFQIPAKVPIDPEEWPSPQDDFTDGLWASCNNRYDKPRALGITKPRLIENIYTPAQASPSELGNFNISAVAVTGSPNYGLLEGTYRFCISFMDSSSGEEGLASEVIEVVIPSSANGYAYTIAINYIHPGYVMPECLVDMMNVYIGLTTEGPLGFYGSFPLAEIPEWESGVLVEGSHSGIYGSNPTTPTDRHAMWRRFYLPISLSAPDGDLTDVLDYRKLAPQSATMPRGAEACRYIRGVLFSGGALGNAGPGGQLWSAEASALKLDGAYYKEDELFIRERGSSSQSVTSSSNQDGDAQSGTLGIAGRCFPDAYQGINILTGDALPNEQRFVTVDRVLNRRAVREETLSINGSMAHNFEILRLTEPVYEKTRFAGSSPVTESYSSLGQNVYYLMPRGQVQIGDPGAPFRATRAFIKLIDPNKGDDITAIGHVGGSAIFCTRKETYSYSWYRNPGSDEPNLMNNEFGCIAGNSMVEFDGGLAWLSERGPVAYGNGLQHVGMDIAEDFYGYDAKWKRDSRGMMRHSWSCHDASRGLVMWGMVSSTGSGSYTYEGATYDWESADDEVRSRWPCDSVLVWSYRASAFSVWRMPSGMRIVWMRPTRQSDGGVRTSFLAEDGRIYTMDDAWCDSQLGGSAEVSGITVSPVSKGSGTTFRFTGATTWQDGDGGAVQRNIVMLLREGMLVEFVDRNGYVTATTTISSVTTTDTSGSGFSEIELSASQTWVGPGDGQRVRIGARPKMTILSTYVGAETNDVLTVDGVQVRYTTTGGGFANTSIRLVKIEDGGIDGEDSRIVSITQDGKMEPLGRLSAGESLSSEIMRLGRRKRFSNGRASAPEMALLMEVQGEAQVRIQDISLEIG